MRKKCLPIILLLCFCLCLTACSGTSPQSDENALSYNTGHSTLEDAKSFDSNEEPAINGDVGGEESYAEGDSASKETEDMASEGEETEKIGEEVKAEKKEEKLVYTCNMTIETTDYEKSMNSLEKVFNKYDAIIDSQTETDEDYGWYEMDHEKTEGTMKCFYTIRVPSKNYKAFLKDMDGNGKITEKTMNVENISASYYDTEATIKALRIQENRLLSMMKEAKTIEDMLTVEQRLTEVQNDLNSYQTQLSIMDTDVAYSTVNIELREVLEYKKLAPGKKTNHFYQRLVNTIKESWLGFFAFLEEVLFLLIRLFPFALVFIPVWIFSAPWRKKYKENQKKKREEYNKKMEEIKKKREENSGRE